MRKRRSFIVAAAAGGLMVAVGCVSLTATDQPGVTRANFNRVREGMSRGDVEAIFGRPCDTVRITDASSSLWIGRPENDLDWSGCTGNAEVNFGADGRVRCAVWNWTTDMGSFFQKSLRRLFPE